MFLSLLQRKSSVSVKENPHGKKLQFLQRIFANFIALIHPFGTTLPLNKQVSWNKNEYWPLIPEETYWN